jgi:uncharacterized membrane protein
MTTQEFAGRVAIVTGASSGIGRATAKMLAERGASVVVFARSEDKLKELASDKVLAVPGDVEDPSYGNPWLWLAIFVVILVVGFLLYNTIMKSIANKTVAAAICLVLFAGAYLLLEYVGKFSGRALYIHMGAIFGTMMAANVWMIIWPYQQRIIRAVKEGTAPDPNDVATAGLRSRHNTFMSVPLVFSMISNHYPTVYGQDPMVRDLILAAIIALGFVATRMMYGKAPKVQGF